MDNFLALIGVQIFLLFIKKPFDCAQGDKTIKNCNGKRELPFLINPEPLAPNYIQKFFHHQPIQRWGKW
jgi:hypothetical protein